LAERNVIAEDAILVLDPDTGSVVSSIGKNLFYMPHGLTVDGAGNMYLTDTGLHQVMRVSPARNYLLYIYYTVEYCMD
jgi:peptidylamidoglycolate lyase